MAPRDWRSAGRSLPVAAPEARSRRRADFEDPGHRWQWNRERAGGGVTHAASCGVGGQIDPVDYESRVPECIRTTAASYLSWNARNLTWQFDKRG